MNRQNIGTAEEFLFGNEPRSARVGLLSREVLAPSYYLHAECETDSCNLRANIPETKNAERFAVKTISDGELPASRT